MTDDRIRVWVQNRKDRATLSLEWIDPITHKRKCQSAKTDNPEKAEQRRADLESDLNNGRYQQASRLSWRAFRELFEDEYLPGLRERSREKYNTVLDVFEDIVSPTNLRSITERTISAFVRGLRERKKPNGKVGLAPITIRNYLVALKTALQWAVNQKLLPTVPNFPTTLVPRKKPQPIPTESFERLLDKAPDSLWRGYLMCGWWAGLRLSEALHLRWAASDEYPWVDFSTNRIILPAAFAKSADDQSVPLHPELRKALENLPTDELRVFPFRSRKTGQPLSRSGVTNRVIHLAKMAGVRLSMHRLRKGFGCRVAGRLGQSGAPVLHELMRHSSMQVTMDYYANVDDAKQEAIKNLI